ncbi:GNAT family N-acetyltransferase|uniref:Ribosomal protein S18 acetylase RimI n=1 Tax=Dendrosporobacter quercicolus TaxID=146817 RepID=A0A1G9YFP0_9FIRM|nr:GNAT family N-acetyltransferase [Dendrosporobacter quercicolus]NSL47639.1 GNAT family N-acetyltransferase [Dendrosporobacter quercicolus DSM 1736]SDN07847.1 Ribosomal protein S18 acetylase RimI [Dendrosporobacter quercicolus]
MSDIILRAVRPEDLEQVAKIEAACFPVNEAASPESFQERIRAFPDSFIVAETDGKLIGFINGCATNSPVIYDELFHSARHHLATGANLTVFGLAVLPEYRKRGIAAQLMNHFIQLAKASGRKSLILTCKNRLVHYYETFGYINNGLSGSTHGGAQWFDMTLTL